MNRRSLLFGATLLAITIPGWNDAFAADVQTSAPKKRLERMIESARKRGRPLLVLPGSKSGTRDGGSAPTWTLYLLEADDRALADLALCDLVCANQDDIQRTFPDAWKQIGPDTQALLVEPADGCAHWIRALLPELPTSTTSADEAEFDLLMTKRNRILQDALHAEISGTALLLLHRQRECEAALSADDRKSLEGMLKWDSAPERVHAEFVPAWLMLHAVGSMRRPSIHLLADVAEERWIQHAPPGSTWESRIGCGGGPCGTGYIPPLSRRFLTLVAEDS